MRSTPLIKNKKKCGPPHLMNTVVAQDFEGHHLAGLATLTQGGAWGGRHPVIHRGDASVQPTTSRDQPLSWTPPPWRASETICGRAQATKPGGHHTIQYWWLALVLYINHVNKGLKRVGPVADN